MKKVLSAKTKIIISAAALALSLIFCAGAVYAWFAVRARQTFSPNIVLRDGDGVSLSVFVYKYNENLLASGSALKTSNDMLTDKDNYEYMSSLSVTIAPGIPVYFMIELKGPKIDATAQPKLELTFAGIDLSSYAPTLEDDYDPEILQDFNLEFWKIEDNQMLVTTYEGDRQVDEITGEVSLIYSDIDIYDIVGNSATLFFRYALDSEYSVSSPTVIGLKKLIFKVTQTNA